jgi:hypothetical protein
MPLLCGMLFQHQNCNSILAEQRQTAYLLNNAVNHGANPKIASRKPPSQRFCTMPSVPAQCPAYPHNACTMKLQRCTIHCNLLKASVQPKQLQKQPETKTTDIVIQQNTPRKPKSCSPETSAQFRTNLHNSEQSLNNQRKAQFSKISNHNLLNTGSRDPHKTYVNMFKPKN